MNAKTDSFSPDKLELAIVERLAAAEARIKELESYLRGFCMCPCCEGVEKCVEGCTIIEESEKAHGVVWMYTLRMQEVRALLYGHD